MGLLNWIKNRPSKIAGYGKKIISYDELKAGGNSIKENVQGFKMKESRSETFNNAVSRLNLSEDDIHEAYKTQMNRFFLYSGFAAIALIFIVWALLGSRYLQSAVTVSFLLIMLAQMMNASFRMYQIRIRNLVGLDQWVKNPDQWLPSNLEYSDKKKKNSSRSNNSNKNNNKPRK